MATPGAAGVAGGFLSWATTRPSGGNTYNRELLAALAQAGHRLEPVSLAGAWPDPAPADRAGLARALAAHPVHLVDGIVGCAAPAEVAAAVAAGRVVVLLVHMPLGADVGLAPRVRAELDAREGRALRAASGVLATSRAGAAELRRRHGVEAVVATPGVRPAPPVPGSAAGGVPHLLALAALSPVKDQLGTLAALATVTDLPWTATLAGPDDADPAYAAAVRAAVADHGLAARVAVPGALAGPQLAAQWHRTDLLLLPSRTETFGLAVTEALARGVPAVVSAGTGAEEALALGSERAAGGGPAAAPGARPGVAVPPGDPVRLAAALRRWLTQPGTRTAWAAAARAARPRLPGWDRAAAVVAVALTGRGRAGGGSAGDAVPRR